MTKRSKGLKNKLEGCTFATLGIIFTNVLRGAFGPTFFCQKLQSQTVIREIKALSYEKVESKMLMKLTPGLWGAFYLFIAEFFAT